jgi:glutamine synthetase
MTQPTNLQSVLKIIEEQEIKFLSLRFTDLEGKWHQVTRALNNASEKSLSQVFTFDGSSLKGWKTVENSDIILEPDFSTFFIDPFCVQATGVVICSIIDPLTKLPYAKDPRNIAKMAEEYFKKSGIGDSAFFGVEPEFFIFDDVRFKISPFECFFKLSGSEMEEQFGMQIEGGNLGHRTGKKGGYNAVPPIDNLFDIRSEILTIMAEVGLEASIHHHEVAQNQCEVGFEFSTLLKTADNTQKCKFVIQNVASSFGKSATFMPKPIFGDNGSGMHVHQSLWKGNKNLFAGNEYAGLSKIAMHYMAGIMAHAEAISAFSNSTVNSYRRLIPGFEAPTMIAYSANNRSAGIRIPYSEGENSKRIETRFPDPASNPYLMLSAMLMAGLDGVRRKLEPEQARDQNLYKSHDASVKRMPASLEQALKNLEKNHDFLLEGGVFTKDVINSYIAMKREELEKFAKIPHPLEFKMYYSR